MKKLMQYFAGVKKEMAKVKWSSKKDMIKYSIATLSFILFFGLFFALSDYIIGAIETVLTR